MDIFSLIVEAKTESGKGSSAGRDKMLKGKGKTHSEAIKSRVKIYASIMEALKKGFVGQIFSTTDSDRVYVITLQKWGKSDEQMYAGRIAKGFHSFPEAKKFAARTMVRHGKSASSNLKKYFKSKRNKKESAPSGD